MTNPFRERATTYTSRGRALSSSLAPTSADTNVTRAVGWALSYLPTQCRCKVLLRVVLKVLVVGAGGWWVTKSLKLLAAPCAAMRENVALSRLLSSKVCTGDTVLVSTVA